MGMPTWVATGAKGEGTGNVTPALPVGWAEDDIFLLHIETANEPPAAITDWLQVPDSPQGIGSAGGAGSYALSVWWRRATSSESAPTITDPGDHCLAVISAYRGARTSGNPYDVTAGDTTSTTSTTAVSIPGDTTTEADCLIVASVAGHLDVTFGTWANADLANVAEVADVLTTDGNNGAIGVAVGEKATAGLFGATTATASGAVRQGHHMTSLVGESGGAPILVDVNPATEQELARAIDPQINRLVAVDSAAEAELANSITAVLNRTVAVGPATEVELGQPITPVLRREVAVGQASEVELGQPITADKPILVDVQPATEAELGQSITPVGANQVPVGQAVESEIARPFAISRSVTVGQAAEAELGRAVDAVLNRQVQVGPAIEIELGRSITPTQAIVVTIGQAVEVELGRSIAVAGVARLGQVVCEITHPGVSCATTHPSATCAFAHPSVTCQIG